jgi:hypothetical protein
MKSVLVKLILHSRVEAVRKVLLVAEERFVDNRDGTVTDTRRNIMWQRGDNGKEITFFDLHWSSEPTVLMPFNYHPSYGTAVSAVYFAREGSRAFVRAVRSLGAVKPDSSS